MFKLQRGGGKQNDEVETNEGGIRLRRDTGRTEQTDIPNLLDNVKSDARLSLNLEVGDGGRPGEAA